MIFAITIIFEADVIVNVVMSPDLRRMKHIDRIAGLLFKNENCTRFDSKFPIDYLQTTVNDYHFFTKKTFKN